MPKEYTTDQAAEELGVTRRRVLALIKAKRLSAEKWGRDWKISASALDEVRERKPGYPRGRPRK